MSLVESRVKVMVQVLELAIFTLIITAAVAIAKAIPTVTTIITTTAMVPVHSTALAQFYYFYFLVFSQILQKLSDRPHPIVGCQ
jgi:hypothetical protein